MYATGDAAAFLCLRTPAEPGHCIQDDNMVQQQTISFDPQVVQSEAQPLKERAQEFKDSINGWLDSRSAFYSRVMGESITRRQSLRVGIMLPVALVVAAVCVEQAPLVAMLSGIVAAWVTYRCNHSE